MKFCAAVIF